MYVLFDAARPHIVLHSASTLAEIAERSAARPELSVGANRDGLSRGLDAQERRELDARVQALQAVQDTSARDL